MAECSVDLVSRVFVDRDIGPKGLKKAWESSATQMPVVSTLRLGLIPPKMFGFRKLSVLMFIEDRE